VEAEPKRKPAHGITDQAPKVGSSLILPDMRPLVEKQIYENPIPEAETAICICESIDNSDEVPCVQCDGANCTYVLFHLNCLGLEAVPTEDRMFSSCLCLPNDRSLLTGTTAWYCPSCTGAMTAIADDQSSSLFDPLVNNISLIKPRYFTPLSKEKRKENSCKSSPLFAAIEHNGVTELLPVRTNSPLFEPVGEDETALSSPANASSVRLEIEGVSDTLPSIIDGSAATYASAPVILERPKNSVVLSRRLGQDNDEVLLAPIERIRQRQATRRDKIRKLLAKEKQALCNLLFTFLNKQRYEASSSEVDSFVENVSKRARAMRKFQSEDSAFLTPAGSTLEALTVDEEENMSTLDQGPFAELDAHSSSSQLRSDVKTLPSDHGGPSICKKNLSAGPKKMNRRNPLEKPKIMGSKRKSNSNDRLGGLQNSHQEPISCVQVLAAHDLAFVSEPAVEKKESAKEYQNTVTSKRALAASSKIPKLSTVVTSNTTELAVNISNSSATPRVHRENHTLCPDCGERYHTLCSNGCWVKSMQRLPGF
jgi:hypothetical protein